MTDLLFLAFDHRASFAREVLRGESDAAQDDRVAAVKALVFEGLVAAAAPPGSDRCLLIDDRYGAELPARARRLGIPCAVAVERSGQRLFEFEHGNEFAAQIERLDPDFAKVLVRYNPAEAAADKELQLERLRRLNTYLEASGRDLLFELLVPPEAAQLAQAGSRREYELRLRPELIQRAIAELQEGGIDPPLWKLEGIDTPADAARIAAQAQNTTCGAAVSCLVLGAGAEDKQVEEWLRIAAAAPGWSGFAIGRSIWRDPVREHLAGELSAAALASRVAARFEHFAGVYAAARAPSSSHPS